MRGMSEGIERHIPDFAAHPRSHSFHVVSFLPQVLGADVRGINGGGRGAARNHGKANS